LVFSLLFVIFISAIAGAWISMAYIEIDQTCAMHTTKWCKSSSSPTPKQNLTFLFQAPLFKDVQIKYHEQQFDGHFMDENVFRKNGSTEVDKAWESLGVDCMPHLLNYLVAVLTKPILDRPGVISYKDGIASGLTDAHVQINPKHGGGFIVNVEGMHHLHCLVWTLK
jgi:hypothetical protein